MYDNIIDFLITAKKNTYAAKAAEVTPSRPASHDLEYSRDNLKYIDSYLGGEKFAGEEAVWVDGSPVWAMNYAGRVLDEGFSGDFLNEALLRVPQENPYRGPSEYSSGGYSYKCTVTGGFEWFQGCEEILLDGKKTYECVFHGGLVR